jgi:outer membrane protein assembly factor BamB
MKKTLLLSLALTVPALSQWSHWRGPNQNGYVEEGKIATDDWGHGKGVAWKAALPGRGCSTPVEAKGQLLLTAPVEGKDALLSYDLKTGKQKWQLVFGEETPGRGQRVGSGANSSVAVSGDYALAYFKSGRVAGVTLDGKKLWEHNLQGKFGETTLWWDQGTSPVAAGGNFVVAVMQTEGNSYLVSFKPETGEVVWKTDRNIETEKESGDSYTTPHVVTLDGVETIVTFGADHLTGHDAVEGKLLWTCGGINPEKKGMWRTIASSVISDGVVVVPHGRGDYAMGIKIGGSGDITDQAVLWRKKMMAPDSATPVVRDGKIIFLVDSKKNRGTVICFDAKTGEEIWQGRLPKSPSQFYASPILVGDHLCLAREDGAVFVAEVTTQGLGKIREQKIGEGLIASPIYAGGALILRSDAHLWCIR